MFVCLTRLSACIAIAFAAVLVGCDAGSPPQKGAPEEHYEGDGHNHAAGGHGTVGPHGGQLVELGADEAFHAELLHDASNHRITVYILDGNAKENVPIARPELIINMVSSGTPKQFKLTAVPQANEQPNTASCFQVESQELCEALDAKNSKGRFGVIIHGKQFVGEIEHHVHEDHKEGNSDDPEQK